MSKNTGILPDSKAKTIPPVIYALLSNALQVYGILVLGWHFFPILYMWWWEELVLSSFGVLKLRRLRPFLLQKQGEAATQAGVSAARGRFFLLFVYFVFVVVMGGFVFAPKGSYIENILTLLFQNQVFNLNLLLFLGLQGWVFWTEFYKEPDFEKLEYQNLQTTLDLRSGIIHAGLLAGALLSFLLSKYAMGSAEHAFMFGFMAIKTLVELWATAKRVVLWNG